MKSDEWEGYPKNTEIGYLRDSLGLLREEAKHSGGTGLVHYRFSPN